jgi:mRNA-degrading endonuclease RelE of RelBE toxin-antitoxin system
LRIYETSKFRRLRKKLRSEMEKEALKRAIAEVAANPQGGKPLKGEFKSLWRYAYNVAGQEKRLIYKAEKDCLYLLSFGPREGIYQ